MRDQGAAMFMPGRALGKGRNAKEPGNPGKRSAVTLRKVFGPQEQNLFAREQGLRALCLIGIEPAFDIGMAAQVLAAAQDAFAPLADGAGKGQRFRPARAFLAPVRKARASGSRRRKISRACGL